MSKVHVLLAVSHSSLSESLKNLLELEDWIEVVGIAENKAQALGLVEKVCPEVVVLDLGDTAESLETGENILKKKPNTKIIMLSVYDYIGRIQVKKVTSDQLEAAESFDWLSKKSSPSDLIESIAQARLYRRFH